MRTGSRLRGTGTAEHNYAGIQQVLVGERFGTWRAWDGIRALDYLLTREEVDPRHLGITGNSGGGTMTTWLCGLDDRWTMAAPSCFVTELRRNMENELGADMEQIPPRALALGLDHEDFLAALAPKPVIILAKEKDYFDARGNEAAYERLKRLYRLLGAEDNVAYFIGPTYHGYSQENREAMYRWFNRCTGISDARTEPKLVMEKEETLWCTPQGQVAALRSKPIHDFTREKSKVLASTRREAVSTPRRSAGRSHRRSDFPSAAVCRSSASCDRCPTASIRSGTRCRTWWRPIEACTRWSTDSPGSRSSRGRRARRRRRSSMSPISQRTPNCEANRSSES